MSKERIFAAWARLDVKKLIIGMATVIVSLVLYIGEMHMSRIDKNHEVVLEEIEKLHYAIDTNKRDFAVKFDKVEDRILLSSEQVLQLAVKIAQLEHLNKR